MSIASNFRNKMDVALHSADVTRLKDEDYRRSALFAALNDNDLTLIQKAAITALMETIEQLRLAQAPTSLDPTKALCKAEVCGAEGGKISEREFYEMTGNSAPEMTEEQKGAEIAKLKEKLIGAMEADRTTKALCEALRKAAERFREYEASHQKRAAMLSQIAIDGPDIAGATAKAERNREMAEMCEATLASAQPSRGE